MYVRYDTGARHDHYSYYGRTAAHGHAARSPLTGPSIQFYLVVLSGCDSGSIHSGRVVKRELRLQKISGQSTHLGLRATNAINVLGAPVTGANGDGQ